MLSKPSQSSSKSAVSKSSSDEEVSACSKGSFSLTIFCSEHIGNNFYINVLLNLNDRYFFIVLGV